MHSLHEYGTLSFHFTFSNELQYNTFLLHARVIRLSKTLILLDGDNSRSLSADQARPVSPTSSQEKKTHPLRNTICAKTRTNETIESNYTQYLSESRDRQGSD